MTFILPEQVYGPSEIERLTRIWVRDLQNQYRPWNPLPRGKTLLDIMQDEAERVNAAIMADAFQELWEGGVSMLRSVPLRRGTQ